MSEAATHRLERIDPAGNATAIDRALAIETPVAIEVNGLAYAVLMASPADVADLTIGFALTERLIDGAADVADCDVHAVADGLVARLTTARRVRGRMAERVRHRASDSACGLCGVETIEQAMRPLPRVPAPFAGDRRVVFAALDAMRGRQPLNAATGAAHAAALCDAAGGVRLVREDVGRHNALDKLIGAMLRDGAGWDGGFALMTSRLSAELVEKAALAGAPMLAAISAPTALAVARAAAAGLPLVALARGDALLATADRIEA